VLTPTARRRRERTDDSEFESNKEQSGAEAVKIAAGLQHPWPEFQLLVTARWRYFK
jgi:hypothetical protein